MLLILVLARPASSSRIGGGGGQDQDPDNGLRLPVHFVTGSVADANLVAPALDDLGCPDE